MRVLLLIAAAHADPVLVAMVEPDAPSALVARPTVSAGRLPLTEATVTVDGLRDPAWSLVAAAPPLLAWADGAPAPDIDLRVAATRDALVLRLDPLPDDATATFSVDPDGSSLAWWQVTATPDGATLQQCTQPGAEEATWPTGAKTWPCADRVASGPIAARGDGGAELAIPWRDMPRATTQARVHASVSGPEGGTWSANGLPGTWASAGLRLERTAAGTAFVTVDAATGRWSLVLRRTDPAAGRIWHWRRSRQGTIVDQGFLDLDQSDTLVLPPQPSGVVALRAKQPTRVADGFVVTVPDALPTVSLATPVYADAILTTFDAPRAVTVTARLTAPDGTEVGVATAALPRGTGVLRLTPPDGAPDLLFVEVEPGLVPVRVLRAP